MNRVEHHGAIFDAATHRPDLVKTPRSRHYPVTANAPERRTQSGHPAANCRINDGPSCFRTDGKTDQTCRGCRTRPTPGPTRPFPSFPRVFFLPPQPHTL